MTEDAYPLTWPQGKPRIKYPQRSRFKASFALCRDELLREIQRIGGGLPILSTNIQLKRDGLPYAGQKEPEDKGVAVYFTFKKQQMCFACDRWDKVGDNIQAIRYTINALRGIERWGTGDMVQQSFAGFVALPAPPDPYQVLEIQSGATHEEIDRAYRHKIVAAHPDNGGSVNEVQRLVDARKKLKENAA